MKTRVTKKTVNEMVKKINVQDRKHKKDVQETIKEVLAGKWPYHLPKKPKLFDSYTKERKQEWIKSKMDKSNYAFKMQNELAEILTFDECNISRIKISVEWKRNSTWGANPTAEVWVYHNGTCDYYTGHASGCGYDKESAAVAEAINKSVAFRHLLLANYNSLYYGFAKGYGSIPRFEGGVGMSCMYRFMKTIGARISESHGKHYDFYDYEF